MIPRVLAALVVVGVPLVTFWTIVFGHDTLYPADLLHETVLPFAAARTGTNVQVTAITDYIVSFYPARVFISQSLRAGELPLWNPFILGGHPQFAAWGTIATFDPFNVLYLLPSLPAALAWRTVLQVVACAAFMALYLGHLGLRPAATAFGGLAFALNSMFYVNIFDYSLSAILWLPLILLAVERGLETPAPRRILAAGLVLAVGLLASPLQFYAFTLFAVVGLGVLKARLSRTPVPWRRLVSCLGVVCAIGFLLSAVQLVPMLELLGTSARRLPDSWQGVRSPLQMLTGTLALVTFVFPSLGGNLKGGMLLAQAWGGTTHYQGYIGVTAVVAAVVGVSSLHWRRSAPYVVLGLGAVALVLYTPLSGFLYERFFIVYIFAAAVLAGMGFDHLAGDGWDAKRGGAAARVLLWGFLAVLAGVLVWTIVYAPFHDTILRRAENHLVSTILPGRYLANNVDLHVQKLRNTLRGLTLASPGMYVPFAVAFAALGLAVLRLRAVLPSRRFQFAFLALLAAELVFMAWTHVPFVDQRVYPLFPTVPTIEVMRNDPDLFRVFSLRRHGMEPPLLSLGMPAAYGLQTVEGKESLYPPNLWTIMPRELQSAMSGVPTRFDVLDSVNVKYVLTGAGTVLPPDQFELVHADAVRVYRNRHVRPRAFLVSHYVVVPDVRDAQARIERGEVDLRATVIVDKEPSVRPGPVVPAGAGATVARYGAREVEIGTSAMTAAILVLSDVYYPGWRASVDGAPVPILRANGAMRAVALPAGQHVVRFEFVPMSVRAGLAISAATLVFVVVAWLLGLSSRGAVVGRNESHRRDF